MSRNPPKIAHTGLLWKRGLVCTHNGRKITCVVVQDARYWKVGSYLHRSVDEAMDRAEGKTPSVFAECGL